MIAAQPKNNKDLKMCICSGKSTRKEAFDHNPSPMPKSVEAILCQEARAHIRKVASELLHIYNCTSKNMDLSGFALGAIFAGAVVRFSTIRSHSCQGSDYRQIFLARYSSEVSILKKQSPNGYRNIVSIQRDLPETIASQLFDCIEKAVLTCPDIPDDIFSWLYQYLKVDVEKNVFKNALQNGKKISGVDMLPTTQFFTEKYMVQHLVVNSFSQLNLTETGMDNLVVLDPACGGANFLIEAMEVLFRKFTADGLAPNLVINALVKDIVWGVEIDSVLAEVGQLNIFLKAYSLNPKVSIDVRPNVLCAKNDAFGLLRRDDKILYGVGRLFGPYGRLYKRLSDPAAIRVLLTNPPFMGPRLMDPAIKEYLLAQYPDSNGDLCLSFMERCLELIGKSGVLGIVNQNAWMFLSTAKSLRKKILDRYAVREVVNLGADAFLDINGEKANVALTIISSQAKSRTIRFVQLSGDTLKTKAAIISSGAYPQSLVHLLDSKSIRDSADYAISPVRNNSFHRIFNDMHRYSEYAKPMQGTSTGDNKKFIKYAWEVAGNPEWRLVSKGGGYARWAGLNTYKVLWGKSAEHIRNNPGSALRNISEADTAELVYSDTGTLGLNVRLRTDNQVFIASGPGIKVLQGDPAAHLAYLNSKTASFFIKALSPKLTLSAGYIGMLPVSSGLLDSIQLSSWATECVAIKTAQLSRKLGNAKFENINWPNVPNLDALITEQILADLQGDLARLVRESQINSAVLRSFGFTSAQQAVIANDVGEDTFDLPYQRGHIHWEDSSSPEWYRS